MKQKKKRIGSCARKLISRIQDKLKKAKYNEMQNNNKLECKMQEGWINEELECGTREGRVNGELERGMREGRIEGNVELKRKEQCRTNDDLKKEKQEQSRSNGTIEWEDTDSKWRMARSNAKYKRNAGTMANLDAA